MRKSLRILSLALLSMVLGACATTVKPLYVSPTQYQAFNCQQLQSEYTRIQNYINQGVQTPKRNYSGVGVGLGGGFGRGGWGFGPTISFNLGQSSNSKNTELSRLLGQQEAISQAATFKNCPFTLKKATP